MRRTKTPESLAGHVIKNENKTLGFKNSLAHALQHLTETLG